MLKINNLSKAFSQVPAIEDFSIEIRDDEYLTLLGPSGSGKTTLLRLIAGLDSPDSGKILLNGIDITDAPPHARGLGFVQQKYALFPHMSVFENVAFGLRHHHAQPMSDESEITKRVNDILELVGLTGLGERGVGQLSGGQKQRVSLARTLVMEPKLCLLDEPLGALDANLRERMTVELRRIRSALGVSFMHVTGNESEALGMGDRMIILNNGHADQIDMPDTVFHQPATVDVARFINNYNILPGKIANAKFVFHNQALGLPKDSSTAKYYVIGVDRISINSPGQPVSADMASIQAAYIASEFMGSRVVYLFERPDGGVFEVERHLSREAPVEYERGSMQQLTWALDDVLTYSSTGKLLRAPESRRVAA